MQITPKEYRVLLEELTYLKKRVAVLEAENERLREENQALKRENIELKDRLGLNSKNSSIPSSKELYKIKKTTKQPSEKKPGAQKGHIGAKRERMTPNEVVVIKPNTRICTCGGAISLVKVPHIIQKIECPPIVPDVIEYQLYKGRCSCCRKRFPVHLPEGVTPDLLGPRLKTIVTSLTALFKGSKRDVQEILKNIFGVDIALGTVSNTEKRVSDRCQGAYDALSKEITQSQQLHCDETGHKNKGARHWAWIMTNAKATVLKFHKSRGMKVIQQLLPNFEGLIISDRYGAYNCFSPQNRQICLAHLMRDFERLANSAHLCVSVYGKFLKSTGAELFRLHRALRDQHISKLYFLRRAQKLRKRLLHYFKKLLQIKDVPRVYNVARLMIMAEPMMWRFLEDPLAIPLTNNAAERQIRHFVIYRKKSFFTWSDRGDRFLERLISLGLTWKQNSQNPFHQLFQLVTA